MILLLHILVIFYRKAKNVSNDHSSIKYNRSSVSNFYNITEIGRYFLKSVQSGDKVNVFINNRDLRLFTFIENKEQDILFYVNGQQREYPSSYAISIDADDNITFNFPLDSKRIQKFRIVMWLIPSKSCPSNSYYTFGNERINIRLNTLTKNAEYTTCIFSFALDSLDYHYNISFGTEIDRNDLWGISSLYTENCEKAEKVVSYYVSDVFYDISESFYIQYQIKNDLQKRLLKSDNNNNNVHCTFYRQIKSPLENLNSECKVLNFLSCNSTFCESTTKLESIETNCFPDQDKKRIIVILSVTVIPVVILVIIIVSVVFCIKKYKKKKEAKIKEEELNQPLAGSSSYNNL